MTDNKIFTYVSLLSLILLPKIGLIDWSLVPLGLFAAAILLSRPSLRFVVAPDIRIAVAVFFILQISAFIASLYHKEIITEDIFFKPLRQIIILVLLAIVFTAKKLETRDIENVIIAAAALNGVIIITQYILHNTGISSEFLLVPSFVAGEVNAPFRKPGLATGYPIAGLLGVYGTILIMSRINRNSGLVVILLFLVSALSVILTSRMALLMLIFVLLVYAGRSLFYRNVKLLAAITTLCGIPMLFVLAGVINQDTINVMFELFIRYLEGGGIQTESTDALLGSYAYWPQSVGTLLFGNGLYSKSDDGFTVDSSAQIVIFGGGIVPLVLYNALLLFYFWRTYTRTQHRLLVTLLFTLDIVSNIKGNTLFSRVIGDVLTLVFVAHVYTQHRYRAICTETSRDPKGSVPILVK